MLLEEDQDIEADVEQGVEAAGVEGQREPQDELLGGGQLLAQEEGAEAGGGSAIGERMDDDVGSLRAVKSDGGCGG